MTTMTMTTMTMTMIKAHSIGAPESLQKRIALKIKDPISFSYSLTNTCSDNFHPEFEKKTA